MLSSSLFFLVVDFVLANSRSCLGHSDRQDSFLLPSTKLLTITKLEWDMPVSRSSTVGMVKCHVIPVHLGVTFHLYIINGFESWVKPMPGQLIFASTSTQNLALW